MQNVRVLVFTDAQYEIVKRLRVLGGSAGCWHPKHFANTLPTKVTETQTRVAVQIKNNNNAAYARRSYVPRCAAPMRTIVYHFIVFVFVFPTRATVAGVV